MLDVCISRLVLLHTCLAPKHIKWQILKVEARETVRSTRSTYSHANSRRICVY